jgi:hypothetical protein
MDCQEIGFIRRHNLQSLCLCSQKTKADAKTFSASAFSYAHRITKRLMDFFLLRRRLETE